MDITSNKFASSVRIAVDGDKKYLCEFYQRVFGDGEDAVQLVFSMGKTYVADVGGDSPFIVSALTVISGDNGERYLIFGGTLPPLRNRGFFSELLEVVKREEKESRGFVFIHPRERNLRFLEKREFVHKAYALECFLKGSLKKPPRFVIESGSGSMYTLLKNHFLGEDHFPKEALSVLHDRYRRKGNVIARVKEGYIAYSPSEEEKGTFNIEECVLTTESLLKLPRAFKTCILPESRAEELKNAKIPFTRKLTALADFNVEGRYINGLFD